MGGAKGGVTAVPVCPRVQLRADGVVLDEPFFAAGSTDIVAGYRAGLRGEVRLGKERDKLVFYGGGTLGRDLSLPRLREQWPQGSLEDAAASSAEWQAAFRGQPPVGPGVEGRGRSQVGERSTPQLEASRMQAFNERLVVTPYTDRAAWADAARDVSGALSALARADKANAAELKLAASRLARSAHLRRAPLPAGRRIKESPGGTAALFMAAAAEPEDQLEVATKLLLTQLTTAAKALAAHHKALGDLRQAEALRAEVVARLERLQQRGHVGAAGGGVATLERPARRRRRHRFAARRRRKSASGGVEAMRPDSGAPAPARDVLPKPLPPRTAGPARITPGRERRGDSYER